MTMELKRHQPEQHGGIATAEQGLVMLDGPNGVAVAMSPEAARETAESLMQAAETAFGQRDMDGMRR